MKTTLTNIARILTVFVIVSILLTPFTLAQEKKELKDNHSSICAGEYKFEIEGLGEVVMEFFVKDNTFLGKQAGQEKTVKLIPDKENKYKFTYEHPARGLYELEFIKSESEIATCRWKIEKLGIDVTGTKVIDK